MTGGEPRYRSRPSASSIEPAWRASSSAARAAPSDGTWHVRLEREVVDVGFVLDRLNSGMSRPSGSR